MAGAVLWSSLVPRKLGIRGGERSTLIAPPKHKDECHELPRVREARREEVGQFMQQIAERSQTLP